MRLRNALGGLTIVAALFVSACNGSNETPPPVVLAPVVTPTPSPTPVGQTPSPTPTPTPVVTPTPTPTPVVTPTPSPTPTSAPASIGGSAVSLSFTAAGNSAQFTVTENNYTGPLTAANGNPSCSGIATFAPAAGTGPSATFTITAVAAGQCTIIVTDNHGGSVGVNVSVTTTSGTISTVGRKPQ